MTRKKEASYKTEKYTFPSRLRRLMKDRGTRQKELADAIGMRPQTVSLYVQGQSFPDVNGLEKISRFFSVSADYLLGLSDTPSIDEDMQVVFKVTGLSEKAISILNGADRDELDFISFLIERRISNDVSSMAYGCAIDKRMIMALDERYKTADLDADAVCKMIRESDDVRKAFNEVKRLRERVDTYLWRCHKTLEGAMESFVDHILTREKGDSKH